MNATQIKANALVTEAVSNYRSASKSIKTAKSAAPFQMMMDRESGKLDALHALFPKLPAWTDTKWIH